mmetsp:Transcript_28124/g.72303  ORF Transcript_28124/g.72303 Transcript_28124/m.72303 type:complete len:229 (-) Transcript_28124:62-748(-)
MLSRDRPCPHPSTYLYPPFLFCDPASQQGQDLPARVGLSVLPREDGWVSLQAGIPRPGCHACSLGALQRQAAVVLRLDVELVVHRGAAHARHRRLEDRHRVGGAHAAGHHTRDVVRRLPGAFAAGLLRQRGLLPRRQLQVLHLLQVALLALLEVAHLHGQGLRGEIAQRPRVHHRRRPNHRSGTRLQVEGGRARATVRQASVCTCRLLEALRQPAVCAATPRYCHVCV